MISSEYNKFLRHAYAQKLREKFLQEADVSVFRISQSFANAGIAAFAKGSNDSQSHQYVCVCILSALGFCDPENFVSEKKFYHICENLLNLSSRERLFLSQRLMVCISAYMDAYPDGILYI